MEPIKFRDFVKNQRRCSVSKMGMHISGPKAFAHFNFGSDKKRVFEISRLKGADSRIFINDTPYILETNKTSKIEIDVADVTIKRDVKGIGHIILLSVSEGSLTEQKKEYKEDVVVMQQDWNEFIKKAGKLKGIRKTDKGIFASEYAEIPNESEILDLQTDPPNAWIRKSGKVVFIHSCRVFGIQMVGDASLPTRPTPKFLKDVNIRIPQPPEPETEPEVVDSAPVIPIEKPKPVTQMIFDSFENRGMTSISSGLHKCYSASTSINMSAIGKFIVPLSILQPNTDYTFNIQTKRVNGNGRLGLQLMTSGGEVRDSAVVIASGNTNIKLSTGKVLEPGETFILSIFRPAKSSTGNIIINRLVVYSNSVGLHNKTHKPSFTTKIDKSVLFEAKQAGKCKNYSTDIESWYNYTHKNCDRNIKEIFRHFAILPKDESQAPQIQCNGSVELTDFYSKVWYNRVRNIFSNLDYSSSNGVSFHSERSANKPVHVQLSSIYSLHFGPRVFLQCLPSKHKFSEDQKKQLKQCTQVLTPSFTDKFLYEEIGLQTVQCYLPWPFIPGKYSTKDYYIYFEEEQYITDKLLSSWPNDVKLLVVGSNVKLPSFAKHISHLDRYSNIVKYIAESKGVIVLSTNTHYDSGLIQLAINCNLPVLTNSHKFIGKQTVVRNDLENNIDVDSMRKAVVRFMERKSNFSIDTTAYNNIIVAEMNKLLGGHSA